MSPPNSAVTEWPKGPDEHTYIGYLLALGIAEHLASTGEAMTRHNFNSTLVSISDGLLTLSDPEIAGIGSAPETRELMRRLASSGVTDGRETAQMIRRAYAHIFDAFHKCA